MDDEEFVEEMMMVVAQNRLVRWGYDKTLEGEEREKWLKERLKDDILRSDIKALIPQITQHVLDNLGVTVIEPCQPIGCDHGYHLPGCVFAEEDFNDGE